MKRTSPLTEPTNRPANMSFPTRPIQPHIRQSSIIGPPASAGQSPALIARVNEKKAELENLKELRDLSAAVATQMEALEQKLATLSDGTEGVTSSSVHCDAECTNLLTLATSYRTCHGQLAQRPPRNQHGFLSVPLRPFCTPSTYTDNSYASQITETAKRRRGGAATDTRSYSD